MDRNEVLITPEAAHDLMRSQSTAVLDCRFRLSEPGWGRKAYGEAHIPGAQYADLDLDLADLTREGAGRHPLPGADDFAASLCRWGIRHSSPVVLYDDAGGAIAARAWWLLRHAGHAQVQVLDGGFDAWADAGLPLEQTISELRPGDESWGWGRMPALDTATLRQSLDRHEVLLVDARGRERFEGREEPLDAKAGHIPGAVNQPFSDNLLGGAFRPYSELRRQWRETIGQWVPEQVVHMCGSGVTACHNVLAMEAAGLSGSRLYWPSWSGWIADPGRPIATGIR